MSDEIERLKDDGVPYIVEIVVEDGVQYKITHFGTPIEKSFKEEMTVSVAQWPDTDVCPLTGKHSPNCFVDCLMGDCARGDHIIESRKAEGIQGRVDRLAKSGEISGQVAFFLTNGYHIGVDA